MTEQKPSDVHRRSARLAVAAAMLLACTAPPNDNAESNDDLYSIGGGGGTGGGGTIGGGGIFDPPPPPPGPQFLAPATFLLYRNTGSVRLRWRDRTDLEDSYQVLRQTAGTGAYNVIRSYGALAEGYYDHVDTTVLPEAEYCYRVRVWRGTEWKQTTSKCVHTPALQTRELIRAQLEITIGDIADAGSNDRVSARLNSVEYTPYIPKGNRTYLDHSGQDFQRGSVFLYDLNTPADLSDVTLVQLEKEGTDGLCVARLRLIVNRTDVGASERVVFDRSYATSGSPCVWIDGNDGHEPKLSTGFAALRAASEWPSPSAEWCGRGPDSCALLLFPMLVSTLEHRVEGYAGHLMATSDKARWHSISPFSPNGRGIQITALDNKTARVHIEVRGTKENSPDADVTIDADVRIQTRPLEDDSGTVIRLSAVAVDADVDVGLGWDVLGTVLGVLTGSESCPNLVDCIEVYIEDILERRALGVSEELRVPAVPGSVADACVTLAIDDVDVRYVLPNCDDIDSDGIPNQWEKENGLDFDNPRDATEDPDGDGLTNLQEYLAGSEPFCAVARDAANYCTACGPCITGQGQCSTSAECAAGRVCRPDVGRQFGRPASLDLCVCPWPVGHARYCQDCGPCAAGTGGCVRDSECTKSATCEAGVCECPLPRGHSRYCEACGPCPVFEGDCDSNAECQNGLICALDVGASHGFSAATGVCLCGGSALCSGPTTGGIGGLGGF